MSFPSFTFLLSICKLNILVKGKSQIFLIDSHSLIFLDMCSFFFTYYGAEGGVLELLETGAPYAPHVKTKIT